LFCFFVFGNRNLVVGKKVKIEEAVLVKMLAVRNEKAMEILYDNYSAALYGVIQRIVQNDEIAEDVLQEAFVKIWNNFLQYDASKGRLFTWMINICRNLSIDKVRSKEFTNQNKNQSIEKSVSSYNQLVTASYNPDTIGIKEIVDKLEPEYYQIIDLLFFKGYSQSEAAEKLNIPLGTVKTRSRAAIQKLKGIFQKELTS
jgi:RNA polymerase sigma factor (sigma-70 family)